MRYNEFKELIQNELLNHPAGLTWMELRNQLDLPYKRPCPSWVGRMEQEIGLTRIRETKRAYIWKISPK